MDFAYQVSTFRAEQLQVLRNVKIHSPSVIQITSGSKRLYWRESSVVLTSEVLLLCEASSALTFENMPHKGRFFSRMFSFFCTPEPDMLQLSAARSAGEKNPTHRLDSALSETLNALFALAQHPISADVQRHWLMGFYQQLAEQGALHRLFPQHQTSFSQKLSHYLARSPSDEHTLEGVAEQFAMSRATLIRKLKQEGTQYRDVLVDVRLNFALELMQKGHDNVAIVAQSCGYQSEGRFSQRFKSRFGLTPKDYMKTVGTLAH